MGLSGPRGGAAGGIGRGLRALLKVEQTSLEGGIPKAAPRGSSPPGGREPLENPYISFIVPRMDGKLSSRLLGDNVWIARLKLRALKRESKAGADVDYVLARIVEVHHVNGHPVYASLRVREVELRILAVDGRVGVALVRPDGGLIGRIALDEALKLPRGQALVYTLRTPLPK